MNKRNKIGLSPGTLIYEGRIKVDPPQLIKIQYDSTNYHESFLDHFNPSKEINSEHTWIDLRGIHDVKLIQKLGDHYNIHKLILEDILDTSHRVKIETYENGIFAILKNLQYDEVSKQLKSEQISIFLNHQVLLCFQEDPNDTFLGLRKRMLLDGSRIRTKKTDYLFYAILDFLVDQYFIVMDSLDEEIQFLETKAHIQKTEVLFNEIYRVRRILLNCKKIIVPLRDEIIKIRKWDSPFIEESTLVFFRDLEDHILHINDLLDNQRELINGIKDLTINQISLSLNKDMKWLAVVSTISIPILFMTGIYGMNFEYMPELSSRYGYTLWWITTIAIIVTLVVYFKKKKFI